MLTLFHDYTSVASSVAVARLQRLADQGLAVEFEGFEAIGVDVALPVTPEVVAALTDLQAVAAAEGVFLRRPRELPPTGLAHLVGGLAEAQGLGASWRLTCYRAFWAEDEAIGQVPTLVRLAARAGLDPTTVEATLADRLALALVRRKAAGHRRNGVGGVPTVLASRTLVPALLPDDDLRALALLT